MGMFAYPVEILSSDWSRRAQEAPSVDTGALYSQFPAPLLRSLGYEPDTMAFFELADGSTIDSPIGDVRLRIGRETRTTTCVFIEDNADSLLGAMALEAFRLAADPVNKTLTPAIARRLTMLPAVDPQTQQPPDD